MALHESEIYETLWNQAHAAFSQGRQQVDAHLANKQRDLRRGVTIVARPSAEVCARVADLMGQLSSICPEQYFYRPEELHVTVLSVISGTATWRNEIRNLPDYRSVIRDAVNRQRAFKLRFTGITASPGAIMVQGFAVDDGLQRMREGLRVAFKTSGFGDVIERRYRSQTAHLTFMRFREPVTNWEPLLPALERVRQLDFGETTVDELQLVWGDWYASSKTVRVLERYRLA